MLATVILALGLTALTVVGVRRSALIENADLISRLIAISLYVFAAPIALAAATPRKPLNKALFFALVVLVAGVLAIAPLGGLSLPAFISPPPMMMSVAAIGFFAFLTALAPFVHSAVRLGAIAAVAGILGAVGGAGYLALEGLLSVQTAATMIALALAVGGTVGLNVAADFSKFFAKGATQQQAAAAACHAAIAPTVFAVLAVVAMFAVQTLNTNFGAVEWVVLWGGASVTMLAAIASLTAVTGALTLGQFTEQVAVDENRRREWFAQAWRPLRRLLPATTALAATAIAGVFVVIAIFEAGVGAPANVVVFFVVVGIAAALAYVSLRSSLLIVAVLIAGALLANYVYAVFGWPAPSLSGRLTALTLSSIALSQLTVSWRNAGEIWRNARDIAQNAMADGLHRFLASVGLGAAALLVVALALEWGEGVSVAAYFATISAITVVLAPITMIALSAKTGGY